MSKKVCVIGAGPSGLVTIKELSQNGIQVKCFESKDDIGGAFISSMKGGQSYDSLKLTVSNYFMAFSDFMPEHGENRRYWSACDYKEYLSDYVRHNELMDNIFLLHKVIHAQDVNNKIIVTIDNGEKIFDELFDHLIICSGSNFTPKFPVWKKEYLYKGKILHSAEYCNASNYKNKKVVCIGLGESGADIVHDVGKITSCKVLLREYPNVIPRWIKGFTNDSYTTYFFYLSKAMGINNFMRFKSWYYLNFVKHISEEDRLIYKWGKKRKHFMGKLFTKSDVFIKDILEDRVELILDEIESFTPSGILTKQGKNIIADIVICNTGYRTNFENFTFGEDFINPRKLFKQMINPKYGVLISLVGWARPTQGGLPACSEMQARYLAHVISQKIQLPSTSVLEKIIKKDSLYYDNLFVNSSDIKSLVSYHDFMLSMAKLIGCKPRFFDLKNIKLTRKLFFGSHISAFYRLTDSERQEKAFNTICSLPVSYSNRRLMVISLFILIFNPLSKIKNFISRKY